MTLTRNHPFLLLAIFTVLVGGAYHLAGIDRDTTTGSVLYAATYALGFIFINATRLARAVIANPAIAGIVSLGMALIPYLLADWLLRRRRATNEGRQA